MYLVGILALVLLVLSVPIGIALGAASAVYILIDPLLEPTVIFRAFFNFIGRYSLMAIPLFIFAGFLMERTGLIGQLFRFADALVGWMPGGFGIATVLACVMFAAISGSSVAMAAAMSLIAIPEMLKRGYPPWLASGIVAASGGIAMLIPPSIILILYGIVTETSIVRLFFAGVVPGMLLAVSNIVAMILLAWYLKLPRGELDLREAARAGKVALPALGMPVVILGGLYGGFFTPTEAAAAACGYALLYGAITGRGQFIRELLPTTCRALNLSAVVLFLVGSVGVFQFLAANLYWPQIVTKAVVDMELTQLGFIFMFMLAALFLGMFLDGIAIVLLTMPVVYPVALALKIDPIHLGIMLTIAVEMSVVTPPVGLNLFAVSSTSKIPISQVTKGAMPFFSTDAMVLLLVIFFPALALWLPNMLILDVFK
ncbi:MAG: TRAP transporter large permease [Betaproteobacteria bacterium]|nr:TRAP transporter large permease [Betaproteobacteria bacterium]MDH3437027.1 TRAP transporter large permease [Betaproteobacteria bacterium]